MNDIHSEYLALIRQGISQGIASEHKRILDLLREELCDEPDCAATYEHAHCQVVQALINRIDGIRPE